MPDPYDAFDPIVATASDTPSTPLPALECDLEVLSWLVCSPQLGGEVTGYLCDALATWALAGRGYPQMTVPYGAAATMSAELPDMGPDCDHLQTLKFIVDRIPQRIVDADGVSLKMDLGGLGRLLSRAFWASSDPQAVREALDRELRMTVPWLADPPVPFRLPGAGVL